MGFTAFAKLFLSEVLIDNFDIVNGSTNEQDKRIDLWLDEKRVAPANYYAAHNVIAYGFTPESVIQDVPVRGKVVFLHIRRCKWQIIKNGKVFSQSFDLTYPSTRLTKELAVFFKKLRIDSNAFSISCIVQS